MGGTDENISTTKVHVTTPATMSQARALRGGVKLISFMPVFVRMICRNDNQCFTNKGLAVFKRRPSRTLMACEEFFQMLMETLCRYDVLPFPDDSVPASYLVQFMIPSAP